MNTALILLFSLPQEDGSASPLGMFLPIILIVVVMYFFMIRPQVKKQKTHQAMLKTLQKGDKVVTSGGIYGKIVNVKDESILLQISDNTKIEILKSAIGNKLEK